jgi:magnesium chelatase family protein
LLTHGCPCGYLGHPRRPCRCPSAQIRKYQSRISGPILDRIDLHVEVPVLPFEMLSSESASENSETIRNRILKCRKIQHKRYRNEPRLNASMRAKELREYAVLVPSARQLMEAAVKELGFSARAYYKILKIARTIADLEESGELSESNLAEALQYRSLDRQLE